MGSLKRRLIPFVAAGALTLGLAMPAAAAQPIFVGQGGLVNVTIIDFADVNVEDVIVQVPVAVAANICPNVDVAALLAAIAAGNTAECTADADSSARGRNR